MQPYITYAKRRAAFLSDASFYFPLLRELLAMQNGLEIALQRFAEWHKPLSSMGVTGGF